ncbi:MAG: SDR family NAD(P)-dependent oxidoreductase, partial [Acidobacteriota bacterium]
MRTVVAETVTGDVRIISDAGQVCLDVVGLTAQLVEVADRRGGASVDQWLYAYRWEPQPRAGAGAAGGGPLASSVLGPVPVGAERDALVRDVDAAARSRGWPDYYDHVEARLDEISAAYIAEAFSTLGCRLDPGVGVSPDGFDGVRGGGWRRSLADQLCRQLARAGFLRPEGDGWQATGARPAADAAQLVTAALRDCPNHRLDVELLARAGPRVAEVLAGHADGRDVLFTDDGFEFLERFYRESPASALYNAEVGRVVARLASSGSASRPLRVLEVGAGTGGTTSLVLPELVGRASRYVFSDASPAFLERARVRFQAYPFLTTAPFDITRPAELQGFEPHSFDLVIAANVLHATPDVDASVALLTPLLAPGGALLLLEITRHPHWLDIVFGLTDGWWALVDRQRRPVHPLMPGANWAALLTERGFDAVAVIADTVGGEPAQSIIVGRRPIAPTVPAAPAEVATSATRWVLLADQTRDVGRRLAAALGARGHACDVFDPDAEIARIYEQQPRLHDAAGVIHLRALDTQPMVGVASDLDDLSACGHVLPVLQHLASTSKQAGRLCVLVTAGAQSVHVNEEPGLLQAPVWGIARTVRKEWPTLGCRLVDLSQACRDEEVEMLADEIVAWTAGVAPTGMEEEEIAFRGSTRLVHRLRPTSRARIADEAPLVAAAAADGWRAEIPVIGALDGIVLRRTGRRAPGPHEVEVAVEAASLNFRDVVVATGVVQGLEASDTFGGRRLGIDMAGTVTRCGANVTRLEPGDAVLGIGQGTFASYVVTDAALVVRRPPHLSAADGSTIPVAFVTVWYALRRLAQLRPGETVLIHAASGGVGLAAIQIAQSAGARIFATAGSLVKRRFVESLGVELVMDSRTHDFADQVRERTGGRGVDVVLNSLPGDAIARGLSALAPYGRFVELGKADIYQNHRLDLGPFRKNLSLFAVDLDRMCFERPAAIGEMLQEVADAFAAGRLQPPPRTDFAMTNLAGAMRYMAQAKHIGKVVVNVGGDTGVRAPIPEHPPVRAEATYLITGGLGGLGLVVARWLIDRGARTLVLAGRSAPSAEAVATLGEFGRTGARVETLTADVSSADDVRRIIGYIRGNLPPLRGIVHAAMVLDDRGLAELDADSMARVMAPKALGAWHLDQATLGDDLEFFVSYSSITSWLGNPLQANYAAANAFLDAFATWRRCRGRPATTINWGVIAGAGYVARHQEVETYLNRQGYSSFTPDETLGVLSELLRHDATSVMAARIDWARFGEVGGRAALSPQIRHLVPDATRATAPLAEGSMRLMLADADPATRVDRVEEYLRHQVAKLLGANAPALDVERPILDLGLDSLIAVELSSVLERDLGVEMAGASLLGGFTIRRLAAEALGRMQLAQSASAGAEDDQPHPPTPAPTPAPEPVAPSFAVVSAKQVELSPPVVAPLPTSDAPTAVDYRRLDYSR